MNDEVVTINSRQIELSNLDKVMFADDGISKGDLVRYWRRIAPTALRHFRGLPLTMRRYPGGIDARGFFQKHKPEYFPDWINHVRLPKQDGEVDHVLVDDAATLVYLANQACIEFHLALACADRPGHPNRLIFDLDPSDDDFTKVQHAARHLKALLDALELPSFVQTTGSRGLHVVVPLDRNAEFDGVREFCDRLAGRLADQAPDLMTVEQRKNRRGDRVYLDTQRNAYGQTAVAPYSIRARNGAPVATPLKWQEALARHLHPRKYHIGNVFRRLAQMRDPWADMARHACSLTRARRRLERLP
jgi:bifunctional non-homologous end joining protein LigD